MSSYFVVVSCFISIISALPRHVEKRTDEDTCFYNGEKYDLGSRVPNEDVCKVCYTYSADMNNQCEPICIYVECPDLFFPLPCVDAITPPGKCCDICPNGPNCSKYGQIYPKGYKLEIGITSYGCTEYATCLGTSWLPELECPQLYYVHDYIKK